MSSSSVCSHFFPHKLINLSSQLLSAASPSAPWPSSQFAGCSMGTHALVYSRTRVLTRVGQRKPADAAYVLFFLHFVGLTN